jgi:hypothetical protein
VGPMVRAGAVAAVTASLLLPLKPEHAHLSLKGLPNLACLITPLEWLLEAWVQELMRVMSRAKSVGQGCDGLWT